MDLEVLRIGAALDDLPGEVYRLMVKLKVSGKVFYFCFCFNVFLFIFERERERGRE